MNLSSPSIRISLVFSHSSKALHWHCPRPSCVFLSETDAAFFNLSFLAVWRGLEYSMKHPIPWSWSRCCWWWACCTCCRWCKSCQGQHFCTKRQQGLSLSPILNPISLVWILMFRLSRIAGWEWEAWDWKPSRQDWRSRFGWILLWKERFYCLSWPFFRWELHVWQWIQWCLGASWVRCFLAPDFWGFWDWVPFRSACYWIGSTWWLPYGYYLPHRTAWTGTNRSFPICTAVLFATIWGVWCLGRWIRWGWVGWSAVQMRLWRNRGCIYQYLSPNLWSVSTFKGLACSEKFVESRLEWRLPLWVTICSSCFKSYKYIFILSHYFLFFRVKFGLDHG